MITSRTMSQSLMKLRLEDFQIRIFHLGRVSEGAKCSFKISSRFLNFHPLSSSSSLSLPLPLSSFLLHPKNYTLSKILLFSFLTFSPILTLNFFLRVSLSLANLQGKASHLSGLRDRGEEMRGEEMRGEEVREEGKKTITLSAYHGS